MDGNKETIMADHTEGKDLWELPPDAEGTDGHAPAHTHKGVQAIAITNWGKKNN